MACSECIGCFQFLAQRRKQSMERPSPIVGYERQPSETMFTKAIAFLAPGRIFGVSSISRMSRCSGDISINAQGHGHKEIARDIAELHTQGYKAIGVKRAQDAVRRWDPYRMHGFIVLYLRGPSGEEKYLRIDWCDDGLHKQLVNSEDDLEDYVARSVVVPAGAGTVAAGFGFAAWTQGGAVGQFLLAPSLAGFWPITIVAGVSVVVAGSLTIVFIPAIWAETSNYLSNYSPPSDSDHALMQLYEYVLLHEQKEYSLRDWNCNHFADGAWHCLTRPPEPLNKLSGIIRKTSYRGWPKSATGITEEWLVTKTGSEFEAVSLAKEEVSKDPCGCVVEVSWWFSFRGGYWAAKRWAVGKAEDLEIERGSGYGYLVYHMDLRMPEE